MPVQVKIVDEHVTAGRRAHAVERIHQRRFTRARRSQQADKLVRLNRQANIVEQLDRSAARSIGDDFGDVDTVDARF